VLIDIAKALALDADNEAKLLASAGYIPDGKIADGKVDLTHPVLQTLDQLLREPTGSREAGRLLRNVLEQAIVISAEKGLSQDEQEELRRLGSITGYFSSGPSRHDRRRKQLLKEAEKLARFLLDERVPMTMRIKIARELNSYAKWRSAEGGATVVADAKARRSNKKAPSDDGSQQESRKPGTQKSFKMSYVKSKDT